MTIRDARGETLTGAGARAVEAFEQALRELQCYIGDPVATIDRALAESPEFVMGYVLKAYLHLLGTEPTGLPVARACYEAAARLPMTTRERGHVEAVGRLIEGEWQAAGRTLEDVAIEHPTDALAIQAGHLIDFYRGDSRMIRDRVARALPAWSPGMPGYHAILGMHAFGLEETGLYDRAERAGRRAVDLEPRDGWAQHAVAHVMEMQGRQRDGIGWMRANPDAWSKDSFFCVHNWWHLALYHLDLDEVDEVLALYDGPIYGAKSRVVLDMIDASALLWRLYLRGVDLGTRWEAVADAWEPIAAAGTYAFNDAHAMMAFVGANRPKAARAVLEAQARALEGAGDNVLFTREVGAPVTRAILAFGEGGYGETVRLLRPVRNVAARFGGSHAQRDLIDLTLIEAALRDGQLAFARALAAERVDLKPTSALGRTLLARASAEPRAA
ncbi:MAG TPA: tetratricopeptide repeat protein [Thermodesulfobacteriota bacterium]